MKVRMLQGIEGMTFTKTSSSISVTGLMILNSLSLALGGNLVTSNPAEAGANGCGSGWKSRLAAQVTGFAGKFNGACNNHDICYETLGRSKPSCDDQFYEDMKRACNSLDIQGACRSAAYTFWRAVAIGGHDAYNKAQAESRAKRDAEIARIEAARNAQAVRDAQAAQSANEERFRRVNTLAGRYGFIGAFPNFHAAGTTTNPIYGTIFINRSAADFRDLPPSIFRKPGDYEQTFRDVAEWAARNGYAGGFPTFHRGQQGVYGIILIKRGAGEKRDVPRSVLGNPRNAEEKFRAVSDYAVRNGYGAAFPDFNYARVGNQDVMGVILLRKEAVQFRDVRLSEMSQ